MDREVGRGEEGEDLVGDGSLIVWLFWSLSVLAETMKLESRFVIVICLR